MIEFTAHFRLHVQLLGTPDIVLVAKGFKVALGQMGDHLDVLGGFVGFSQFTE